MKRGSLDGVPDRVSDSRTSGRFCEDCVSDRAPGLGRRCDPLLRLHGPTWSPCLPGADEGTAIGSLSSTNSRDFLRSTSIHQSEISGVWSEFGLLVYSAAISTVASFIVNYVTWT